MLMWLFLKLFCLCVFPQIPAAPLCFRFPVSSGLIFQFTDGPKIQFTHRNFFESRRIQNFYHNQKQICFFQPRHKIVRYCKFDIQCWVKYSSGVAKRCGQNIFRNFITLHFLTNIPWFEDQFEDEIVDLRPITIFE